MTIDFACPKCGAPFTVPSSLAGKTGRCKKCRHQMTIPASKPVAAQVAASGMFRLSSLSTAGAGAGPVRGASARPADGGGLGFPSHVGLAPLTEEVRPVFGKGAPPLQKQYSFNPDLLLENSAPGSSYKLVASHKVLPTVGRETTGARTPGFLERIWRSQARAVLRVVRQLSDLVYLLTVPCVILILVAIVLDRRDLAVLGATGVIVLSLLRLVLEGFALVAGPFKENPLQGILFLIPPFTFIYLSKYPKRTKKALGRVLAPMGWILGVILAFAFIPQLSSGEGAENGSTLDRARTEVNALKGDVSSELEGQGVSLDAIRDSETGRRAGEALGELKSRAREGLDQAKQALPPQNAPASEPNP